MVDLAMIERVYDAFINAHGSGSAIQKTGARSLFTLKLPELASLSRNQVGDAIDALIAEGRIAKGPHGLEPTIPPAPTK